MIKKAIIAIATILIVVAIYEHKWIALASLWNGCWLTVAYIYSK